MIQFANSWKVVLLVAWEDTYIIRYLKIHHFIFPTSIVWGVNKKFSSRHFRLVEVICNTHRVCIYTIYDIVFLTISVAKNISIYIRVFLNYYIIIIILIGFENIGGPNTTNYNFLGCFLCFAVSTSPPRSLLLPFSQGYCFLGNDLPWTFLISW